MVKVVAKCPFCRKESSAEMAGGTGFMLSLMRNDTVSLGCEHAVRFNNGTVFFSTVTFVKDDRMMTVPANPVQA